MDNRVALAKVSFTDDPHCFVGVTKNLARLLTSSSSSASSLLYPPDDSVVVFELLFDKSSPPVYVSWSGDVVASSSDVLTINADYASSLGLTQGIEVIVRPLPPAITPCQRYVVEKDAFVCFGLVSATLLAGLSVRLSGLKSSLS